MARIGIKRIGFAEQNEVDDTWTVQQAQQQQADRGAVMAVQSAVWHWFDSIDQDTATLEEELTDDDGLSYTARLDFTVRTDADIKLAVRYARRPLVIQAVAVDGRTYTMGTKPLPTRFTFSNRYATMQTREAQLHATYDTLNGIMR